MKKSFLIIGAIVALLVVVSIIVFSQTNPPTKTPLKTISESTTDLSTVEANQKALTTVAQSELSKHNNKEDCWVVYESKVYDITTYIPKHPEYIKNIVPYCGTSADFQNAFTSKHGTSKVSVLMSQGVYKGEFS